MSTEVYTLSGTTTPQFPILSEYDAMEYVVMSLVTRRCLPFKHMRVSMQVELDIITVEFGNRLYSITTNNIDDVIVRIREHIQSMSRSGIRPGFYPLTRDRSPSFSLGDVNGPNINITSNGVLPSQQVTMTLSRDFLSLMREDMLGISPRDRSFVALRGAFATRYTYGLKSVFVFRHGEQELLNTLNTALGPIPHFGLRTYMCVVGKQGVDSLIAPLLPYYGGKYLGSDSDHHHYVFPSEQHADEAYCAVTKLPGIKMAMTAYDLKTHLRSPGTYLAMTSTNALTNPSS